MKIRPISLFFTFSYKLISNGKLWNIWHYMHIFPFKRKTPKLSSIIDFIKFLTVWKEIFPQQASESYFLHTQGAFTPQAAQRVD